MDESWDQQRGFALEVVVPEKPKVRSGFTDKGEEGCRRVLLENFALGMPPSANNYWHTRVIYSAKDNRHIPVIYLSGEARAYREHVGEVITNAKKRFNSPHPLRIQVALCFASNGRVDSDNRIKPLFDALQAAQLFKDDCQIEQHEVRRGPTVKGGRVLVSCVEILPDRIGALTWVKQRA